ncbi:hypothetical protein ANANG_G00085420 [Anguilla anguilla]|uniref:Uncharacterized protein n=2 Tax=Anguilla anguilla TaxID=7936 RepID=A0A9D3MQG7_ANGAN|nr:hypothetical protein ANANG_G00085420 [Anguilla anguilla]
MYMLKLLEKKEVKVSNIILFSFYFPPHTSFVLCCVLRVFIGKIFVCHVDAYLIIQYIENNVPRQLRRSRGLSVEESHFIGSAVYSSCGFYRCLGGFESVALIGYCEPFGETSAMSVLRNALANVCLPFANLPFILMQYFVDATVLRLHYLPDSKC